MALFLYVLVLIFINHTYGEELNTKEMLKEMQTQMKKQSQMLKEMQTQKKRQSQVINDLHKEVQELRKKVGNTKHQYAEMSSYTTSIYNDLYDLQWQSLHMAAAAACRGSTLKGGHGGAANYVMPQKKGLSCRETCKNGGLKYCDSELAILGFKGRVKEAYRRAGYFYNYNCDHKITNPQYEGAVPDTYLWNTPIADNPYISYCCCRYK